MKKTYLEELSRWFRAGLYVLCCAALFSLPACSDDDDGDGGSDINPPSEGLVSTDIPSLGWEGPAAPQNGIVTYRPQDAEDEGFYSAYYAFNFEGGVVKEAVFNIVCEEEAIARELQRRFSDGTWMEDDEEDEEYDSDYEDVAYAADASAKGNSLSAARLARLAAPVARALKAQVAVAGRAADNSVMGLTCTQDGRIVYFKLDWLAGQNAEDVQCAMRTWDTGLNMDNLPTQPIFGEWNDATGVYTGTKIYGLPETQIQLTTAFDEADLLTDYAAHFTLPHDGLAALVEEEVRSEASDYEQLGIQLGISRQGKVVSVRVLNAAQAKVSKEYIVKMIIAMDILMARPIYTNLF